MTTFPIARYRFESTVNQPLHLPDYAGSMLRGAFGHALRQLACMTRQPNCAACPVLGQCPYPAIFAPPPPDRHDLQAFSAIPVPYIIEPPEWGRRTLHPGDTLAFNMVLVGRALRELPLIILAWRRALARGIGANDATGELARVVLCASGQEIYRPQVGTIATHVQEVVLDDSGTRLPAAILHFRTPLRLQRNGRALPPDRLDVRTLLMALVRRVSLLAELHAESALCNDFSALAAQCAGISDTRQLAWRDWARYSSRQEQKMSLGGVVGTWTLRGDLSAFRPFLRLGEYVHVGKEASFGLGAYDLEEERATDIWATTDKTCDHRLQVIETKLEKSITQ